MITLKIVNMHLKIKNPFSFLNGCHVYKQAYYLINLYNSFNISC